MKFFRDVVSHLIKNAFEAHTQFSVADDTAVGDDVVRSVTLDAVPTGENTIISLSWEGGVKLFEKSLPEMEASHQFDLISTDLAEVASLTKQGQYDSAKDLMKKLGQKYAENTGEIVDTNLPKLHVTQAAQNCPHCPHAIGEHHTGCEAKGCRCEMTPHLIKNYKEASVEKKASTDYYFSKPVSLSQIKKLRDLQLAKNSDGSLVLTDGDNYLHLDVDEKGLVTGGTRFGANDPSFILDELSQFVEIKDEHEMQEIWYAEDEAAHNAPDHVCDEYCSFYEEPAAQAPAPAPTPAPAPKVKKQPKKRSYFDPDATIWKEAKVSLKNVFPSGTVQEMTFDTAEEAKAYQGKSTPGAGKPLWEQNKGKAPAPETGLAPASLSYEDAENERERDHEDIQKQIDEKIKTELESALQEKAASVFGPDQIELIKILKKNGRNWDEIKKILVKDFGFDKDSTNIFVDEQRQALDPAGIEVEPVQEDKKEAPLTPPEELVSPETHDKLLQDHEDKKKDKTPLKEPSFTPQDVMNIPEEAEIQNYSSEIARADNSDIHKIAAPSDANPLQEPLKEEPTTPNQDTIPFGKSNDHNAPQHGDRVFVSSDLSGEKAGFEATFVSTYQSKGTEFSIVQTDDGDMLEVETHRVSKTAPNAGPQEADPMSAPQIEQPKDEEIPVTPKQTDLASSQENEALSIKAELEKLATLLINADDEQLTMWDERSYDEKYPMMAKHPNMVDPVIEAVKKYGDNWNRLENELFYKYPYYMMNMSHAVGSRDGADMINEVKNWLAEHESTEDKVWVPRKYEASLRVNAGTWAIPNTEAKAQALVNALNGIPNDSAVSLDELRRQLWNIVGDDELWDKIESIPSNAVWKEEDGLTNKQIPIVQVKQYIKQFISDYLLNSQDFKGGVDPKAADLLSMWIHQKEASDFENGISQNKTSADPVEGPKTHFKELKRAPDYAPSGEAIPADQELAALLDKMDTVQANLETLKAAREQVAAKMSAEIQKIDEAGGRAELEAQHQEMVEQAGAIINALETKVAQHKDKLYTLQTQETHYVEKLTPSDIVKRLYKKYADAEQYITDVKNGFLAQAKKVMEKTLYKWPNRKASGMETQAEPSVLDEMQHYNDELMAALQILSAPTE